MLALLIFLAQLHLNFAQFDYSCTEFNAAGAAVFTQQSTICQDKLTLPECTQLFTLGHAPVIPGSDLLTVGRPFGCYGIHGVFGINDGVKSSSVEYCPKFCGFCCLTPEYNCANAPAPQLDCGTVTQDMCRSLLWRELIARDCPSVCGFCLLGGCIDVAPDCEVDPTICGNPALSDFTNVNCKRTCGLCDTSSTTSITNSSVSAGTACTATDRSSDCALWNRNGFCASPFYTEDQKREYCAATCGLCDNSSSSATITANLSTGAASAVTEGSACPADTSSTCTLWNKNGFCNSTFYTEEHKRAYCATTCALC